MLKFDDYLNDIENKLQRDKMNEILAWVIDNYPNLKPEIKWNQPMFIDGQTYIIGFSISKKHFSISPEVKTITKFINEIEAAGYDHTKNIIRVGWEQELDFELLSKMIDFNISDKAGFTKFWR